MFDRTAVLARSARVFYALVIVFIRKLSRTETPTAIVFFDYLHIIWAALLGFFIWGEAPGNTIWIGTAIVMASGIYILFREAHLALPRGIARRLTGRR